MDSLNLDLDNIINNAIDSLLHENVEVTFSTLYKKVGKHIRNSYSVGSDVAVHRRDWKSAILNTTKAMETTVNDDSMEKSTFMDILNVKDNGSSNDQAGTSTQAKKNTTTSSKSLSADDKAWIKNTFDSMDVNKMWVLSTGKVVEQEMWRYASGCNYEDQAHSFIMDLDNTKWQEYFSRQELDEIKNTNKQPNLLFPTKLADFLGAIEYTTSAKAATKVARINDFDDDDGDDTNDCRWAQLSIMDAASLFSKRDNIDFGALSEADILHGPWRILFTGCRWSVVDVHAGELSSTASGNSRNNNRQPQSAEERYQVGAKMDGLYVGNSRELGCIEAGRSLKENTSKEFSDGYLKLPKTLKDMLAQLAKEEGVKADGNRLMTVGFLVMGNKVQLLQMDCPAGYVGRLVRSKPYYFPCGTGEFAKTFVAIIKVAWMGLKKMEATLDFITNKKQPIEVEGIQMPGDNNSSSNNNNNNSILIQPVFHRQNTNKKRKTSTSS